jgi:hypothetical protein
MLVNNPDRKYFLAEINPKPIIKRYVVFMIAFVLFSLFANVFIPD